MKATLSDGRSLPAGLRERVPAPLRAKFKRGRDLSPLRSDMPEAVEVNVSGLRLERYGRRFWAVYEGEKLLCVTVYKKGARAVIDRIEGDAPEGRTQQSKRPEPCGSDSSSSN